MDLTDEIKNLFLKSSGDEAYVKVLQLVLEATGSRFGIFGYLDEKGDLVVPSMTRDIWDKCQMPEKSIVFPRTMWGDSIWVRAIKQKRTLFSNELSLRTPKGHIPLTRNVAIPIIHEDHVVGLFQVANRESDYDDGQIKLLEQMAAAVAPLLRTARSASGEGRGSYL